MYNVVKAIELGLESLEVKAALAHAAGCTVNAQGGVVRGSRRQAAEEVLRVDGLLGRCAKHPVVAH